MWPTRPHVTDTARTHRLPTLAIYCHDPTQEKGQCQSCQRAENRNSFNKIAQMMANHQEHEESETSPQRVRFHMQVLNPGHYWRSVKITRNLLITRKILKPLPVPIQAREEQKGSC